MNHRQRVALFRREQDQENRTRHDLIRWLDVGAHAVLVAGLRAGTLGQSDLESKLNQMFDELLAVADKVRIPERIVDVLYHPTFGYVTEIVYADGSRKAVRQLAAGNA